MMPSPKIIGVDAQARDVFGPANSERTVVAARIVEQYAAAYVETRAWNAAYRRLHDCSNMKPGTVNANAAALADYPGVRARVRELLTEAAQRTIVTVAEVLERNMMLATADPSKVVGVKRFACRHCHGLDNEYQWRTQDEYTMACAAELDLAVSMKRLPKLPSDAGGFGYSLHRAPNPECETCGGIGDARVMIVDPETLTGGERLLFKSCKQDRFGAITVELHDQQKALQEVARILGAYKDSLSVTPKAPPPAEIPADTPRERIADAYLQLIG